MTDDYEIRLETTDEPASDAELDAEVHALHLILAAACNGAHTRVIISTLATTLATVVGVASKDMAGIDAFAQVFHDELRDEWLKAHATERAD